MTHFARTELASHNRLDMDIERTGNQACKLANRRCLTASHVDGLTVESIVGGNQQVRAGDVIDETQVACLGPILVDYGRLVAKQTRAEYCDNSRVGIEDRLPWTIRAGIAQRDSWNSCLSSPCKDEPLLVHLRDGINTLASNRRFLDRGHRGCLITAVRTMDRKVACFQLFHRAYGGEDQPVPGAL